MNFINFFYRKYLFYRFKRKWRIDNQHNFTIPIRVFPSNTVLVGKMVYGFINIENFDNSEEKLIIRDYVSIANNVVFILGGNHQMNTISSYPLFSKLVHLNPELDSLTKGSIIVEDEVWIGYGSIILSGIRIGKGAIVAAGSVVTKDIPPYAIVGGNPARIIRYRFDEEILRLLRDFNLSSFNESDIINNIDLFYDPLNVAKIKEINTFKNPK